MKFSIKNKIPWKRKKKESLPTTHSQSIHSVNKQPVYNKYQKKDISRLNQSHVERARNILQGMASKVAQSKTMHENISVHNANNGVKKINSFSSYNDAGDSSEVSVYSQMVLYITSGILLLLIIMSFVASGIYIFISQGNTMQIVVPDVTDVMLDEAIIMIQERGAHVTIERQYHKTIPYFGIIAQEPVAGRSIRYGQEVKLIMSLGSMQITVQDFVGKSLTSVEQLIDTQVLTEVYIANVTEVASDKPRGIILKQDPVADTILNMTTPISFLVSSGPQVRTVVLPSVVDLYYISAIQSLADENIAFNFSLDMSDTATPGRVLMQTPSAGSSMLRTEVVHLVIGPEETTDETVFGIFTHTLPYYGTEMPLEVEIISSEGTVRTYFKMRHRGGTISFPYQFAPYTTIVLKVAGKMVYQYPIYTPVEQTQTNSLAQDELPQSDSETVANVEL